VKYQQLPNLPMMRQYIRKTNTAYNREISGVKQIMHSMKTDIAW